MMDVCRFVNVLPRERPDKYRVGFITLKAVDFHTLILSPTFPEPDNLTEVPRVVPPAHIEGSSDLNHNELLYSKA
ncbi:hypothetical protein MRX96_014069 [Rhipicephalus microplus]